MAEPYDAVVLAGGRGRRLAGADKPALVVGGRSLLERVLHAVADARQTVVVGPRRTTGRPVVWCREQPPGGGPGAALAAALPHVTSARVVLLAADLPFLTSDTVAALLSAARGSDGALLVDSDGREQLLVGAWRTDALRAAVPEQVDNARLAPLLLGLQPALVDVGSADRPPWFDCDTAEDVATAVGLAVDRDD